MPTEVFRVELPENSQGKRKLTRFERSFGKQDQRLAKMNQANTRAIQPSKGARKRSGGANGRPRVEAQDSLFTSIEERIRSATTTVTAIHDFLIMIKDTVQAFNEIISGFKTTLSLLSNAKSFLKGFKKRLGKDLSLSGKIKTFSKIKKIGSKVSTDKAAKEKIAKGKSTTKRHEQVEASEEIINKGRGKTKKGFYKTSIKKSNFSQKLIDIGGKAKNVIKKGKGAFGKIKGLKLPYLDIAMGAAEIISAGRGNRWAKAKEVFVEKGGSGIGTAIGTIIGGPLGGAVGNYLGGLAGEKLFAYLDTKFSKDNQKLSNKTVNDNRDLVVTNYSNMDAEPIPYNLPSEKVSQELQITVNVSPDFKVNTYIDAEEVLKVIKTNLNTITEEIGDRLAETLQGTCNNTVLDVGN